MTEKKSVTIEQLPVVVEMAEQYHLTGPSLVHTVRTVAVDGTISETELLSCLMVAKEHGLNPLTREIYFIKGRLKFSNSKNAAPFPSAIVVFGPTVRDALEEQDAT